MWKDMQGLIRTPWYMRSVRRISRVTHFSVTFGVTVVALCFSSCLYAELGAGGGGLGGSDEPAFQAPKN